MLTMAVAVGWVVVPTLMLALIGVLLAVSVIAWSALPSLEKAINAAIRIDNPSPVLALVQKETPRHQVMALHRAILSLWSNYQRPLAIRLIRATAQAHSDHPLIQYWIDEALAAEPHLAMNVFDSIFIRAHYRSNTHATAIGA